MEAHQIRDQETVSPSVQSDTPPNSILVIKTRSIGDNIIMLPALRMLRNRFPDAAIEVLTTAESAAPLLGFPLIDAVHCFRKKAGAIKRLRDTLFILKLIRSKRFDLAICLQASSGSERLTLLCGARRRLIYPYGYGKCSRYSHYPVCKPGKVKQTVLEDIDALRPLNIGSSAPQFAYPLASITRDRAREVLKEHSVDAKKFVVLHPGGGEREKRWSPHHYGALVDRIKRELSFPSVVLFTEDERQLFESIALAASERPIGISVPFDLLAAIIEASRVFIGSDSAPHHIACALDIPSIVLMPRDRRETWHPYDVRRHRFLIGRERAGSVRRIDHITPDVVFAELLGLLSLGDVA